MRHTGLLAAPVWVKTAVLLVLGIAVLHGPTHAQGVRLTLSAESSGARPADAMAPFRVLMLVDGSSSMLPTEPGTNASRWTRVQSAIRKDLATLASAGVPIELTVAKFASKPSEIASGSRATLSPKQVETISEDVIAQLGRPSGETALHKSIQDAINALMRDLGTGRYSGGQLIIYSDGQDSAKTSIGGNFDALFSETQRRLADLRSKNPEAIVCIRPFGQDARVVADELAKQGFRDLSKVELTPPPRVVALRLSPGAQTIESLAAAREQSFTIRADGLDEDAVRGIEVTVVDGQRRTPAWFSDGAWRASIPLERSESGAQIQVIASGLGVAPATAAVTAEALTLPPRPEAWGLPTCGNSWGMTVGVGQRIPLSVRAPAEAVSWSSVGEPDWSAKGAAVEHPGFTKPGTYQLRATVRSKDGAASADVRVTAVDPALVIAAPSAPVAAGTPVEFVIDPKSPAIASGASARGVKWLVDGREAGQGDKLRWTASRRGRYRIEAAASLTSCGQEFACRGVAWLDVLAVPTVELGDAELVRGASSNRITARVFEASQVPAVLVSFGGLKPVRIAVPAANAAGDSAVEIPVPGEALGSGDRLRISVAPEIKTDDGGVAAAGAEEVRRGSAVRDYPVRAPQPRARFTLPLRGKEAAYEKELEIEVSLEGSAEDLASVAAVLVDTGSGPPVSLVPGNLRTAKVPRFAEHKGSLRLSATPVAKDGSPVGGADAADSMVITLTQAPLALKRTDGEAAVRWKTASPPTAKFVIESPGSADGWESTISGTPDWSIVPADAVRIITAGKTELVLEVTGSKSFQVSARVRREGAGDSTLGPVDVPVAVDPMEPKFSVTYVGSDSSVRAVVGEATLRIRDQSTGPVARKSFVLRREGMPDQAIESPDSFVFAEAGGRGQTASVEATYTAMDGSTKTVRQEFTASKDHNWVLVALAAIVALGLSALTLFLCTRNDYLGAQYVWSGDELGTTAPTSRRRIRWLRGQARASVISKRARIPLPTFHSDDYEWLSGRGRAFLELGGNLPRPRTSDDSMQVIPEGTGRVKRAQVRPTGAGMPVYLEIQPNESEDFLAWTSSLLLLGLIWAAFAMAFFRGYI